MPEMRIICVDSLKSTNSYMSEMAGGAGHGTVVVAREQTVGRGQRGNSWEAEPGKNLTFSLMIRPDGILASEQFFISEAVALGVVDALKTVLPQNSPVTIKWPNDIYWNDKKICGILIENSLTGKLIDHSIAGIGINVNQREFVSDAPNPVSVIGITGCETDLNPFLEQVVIAILERLKTSHAELHGCYMDTLWGRDGRTYKDVSTGDIFHARISDVAPSGHLTLLSENGDSRVYAFKEVAVML